MTSLATAMTGPTQGREINEACVTVNLGTFQYPADSCLQTAERCLSYQSLRSDLLSCLRRSCFSGIAACCLRLSLLWRSSKASSNWLSNTFTTFFSLIWGIHLLLLKARCVKHALIIAHSLKSTRWKIVIFNSLLL